MLFARRNLVVAVLAVVAGLASVQAGTATAASGFPETIALEQELWQARQRILATGSRLGRAEQATENARQGVQQAIALVRNIDQLDDQLDRLIRQLRPISKLPPTRSLRPLVTNLERIHAQVHALRLKADRARQQVLQPLANRLTSIERSLEQAIRESQQLAGQASQAQAHVRQLRAFVEQHGNLAPAIAGLENLSRGTRAGLQPLWDDLAALDNAGAAAERDLVTLTRQFTSFNQTGSGLERLRRDLTPVDRAAANLDRVLSHRLQVKVFGKTFGFSVRQIIETPGEIIDIVLKPMEKLAQKLLGPVLNGFKLEVKAPHELAALSSGLDNLTVGAGRLNQTLARLEQPLRSGFLRSCQNALANLLAR